MIGVFKKLYKEYNEGCDIFVKPSLHFQFSTWRNNHCLPVWRRGPILSFGKHYQYDTDPQSYGAWAKTATWNPTFLKSCSKFGRWWRSFIRPTYQLPIWLAFGVYSSSLGYKSKYDDWRYEYSPYVSIVFFGLCACWWTSAPKSKWTGFNDDNYWESFMNMIWEDRGDITPDSFLRVGWHSYIEYSKEEEFEREKIREKYKDAKVNTPEYEKKFEELKEYPGTEIIYLKCQPEYLKEKYRDTYYIACEKTIQYIEEHYPDKKFKFKK